MLDHLLSTVSLSLDKSPHAVALGPTPLEKTLDLVQTID